MNGIAERLLGVEERSAFGRDLFADQRDARFAEAWSAFVGGDDDLFRGEIAAADRESRSLAVAISRIRTGEGRPAGAVAVLRDSTAERTANQKSRELVLDIAQGLRASIAAIRGFTGTMARDEGASSAAASRSLGPLAKEVERLHRTVEQFLILARLDAGRDALHASEARFLQVLRDVEESFAPAARARGARLEVHASDLDGKGHFDAEKMRRVLDVLVGSSVKRAAAGGAVRVELRREGGRFHVTVRDDGARASAEENDLGRALVRRLIELHGGTIEEESAPGQGTTTRFSIPDHPPSAAPRRPPRTPVVELPAPFADALVDDPDDEASVTLAEGDPLRDS
jgi:signal transduction histidine kinase